MPKPNPRSPDRRPWHPAKYSVDIVYAVQKLARGQASEVQQKMALDFIIHGLCGTYDATYFSDSPRDSDFAQAKRHVGLQLVKLVNMPAAAIDLLDKNSQGRNREPKPEGDDE